MTSNTQHCRKCNTDKPLTQFHIDRRTQNNRRTVCGECRNKHKKTVRISSADRKDLLEEQNNSCGICGVNAEELPKQLAVDHNHETNVVRGLLCNQCNLGLGQFKDSVVLLSFAIEYLEQHDGIA